MTIFQELSGQKFLEKSHQEKKLKSIIINSSLPKVTCVGSNNLVVWGKCCILTSTYNPMRAVAVQIARTEIPSQRLPSVPNKSLIQNNSILLSSLVRLKSCQRPVMFVVKVTATVLTAGYSIIFVLPVMHPPIRTITGDRTALFYANQYQLFHNLAAVVTWQCHITSQIEAHCKFINKTVVHFKSEWREFSCTELNAS